MIQLQKCNKMSWILGLFNDPNLTYPNSKLPYIALMNKDRNLMLQDEDSVAKMQ